MDDFKRYLTYPCPRSLHKSLFDGHFGTFQVLLSLAKFDLKVYLLCHVSQTLLVILEYNTIIDFYEDKYIRYHVDFACYWLTDTADRDLPIPYKVFMVTSRSKSKVIFCIELSWIFLHKDWHVNNSFKRSYLFIVRLTTTPYRKAKLYWLENRLPVYH